jgi:hypothetical protein
MDEPELTIPLRLGHKNLAGNPFEVVEIDHSHEGQRTQPMIISPPNHTNVRQLDPCDESTTKEGAKP